MISIAITEEAYEALKARMPRIDQAPTSRGRNGQMRISLDRKFVDRLLELPCARRELQRCHSETGDAELYYELADQNRCAQPHAPMNIVRQS